MVGRVTPEDEDILTSGLPSSWWKRTLGGRIVVAPSRNGKGLWAAKQMGEDATEGRPWLGKCLCTER